MAHYYFLVASLPAVAYDTRDAMTSSEFLERARMHLGESEFAALASASITAPPPATSANGTVGKWLYFERGLRNALVRLRAGQLHLEAGRYLRIDPTGNDAADASGVTEIAREAAAHETPLGGEDTLNHARWSLLDDLETGHFFDLDLLIVYYLRLQILERRHHFTRREGEERYNEITEGIMNEYYQGSNGERSE